MSVLGMPASQLLKLLAPLILAELGLKAYCLWLLGRSDVRWLPRWAWALIILLISTFGPLSFLLFGRARD